MALYWAVIGASWVVTRLPLRVSYALADLAGIAAYGVARKARTAITSNLAVVLDQPPASTTVRRTAVEVFRHNAKNWVDSLRLGSVSPEEIKTRVQVDGWAVLEEVQGANIGVLMIGAHVGNIDVVGQVMAARGLDVTVPVEAMKPERLFQRTQRLRQSLGIKTIPVANSARSLLRALRSGGIVGIMADRRLGSEGIEVLFFGRKTLVSRGPAWLATHAASPVLIGTGIRQSDGTFRGLVSQVTPRRTGDPSDVEYNAQTIMLEIEKRIRAHPGQWCMFVPMWS